MIKIAYTIGAGGIEFSIESDTDDYEATKKKAHHELKYIEESFFRMLKMEKAINQDATDDASSLPSDKNVHKVDGIRFKDTNSIMMHQ